MKRERLTQKGIAEKLGISITTVSRALRDLPDISNETKKAVLKLAKEGHYLPNTNALGLRKNETRRIGVIIPEIVHFFFSSTISGIMECADKHGYSVLLSQTNESYDREMRAIDMLFSTHVDGMLVCLSNETRTNEHFSVFQDYGIPVVFFDKIKTQLESSSVVVNDKHGAVLATQHLIDMGCKRIAHLKGPIAPINSKRRFQGYVETLEENNYQVEEDIIKEGVTMSRKEGYEYTKELLRLSPRIDGIFAASDMVAVGAMDAIREAGLVMPDDVAVVGFSDSEIASMVTPQLSSVYQPGFEIGYRSLEILLDEIKIYGDEKIPDFRSIMLDTSLVIRESSGRKDALASKD